MKNKSSLQLVAFSLVTLALCLSASAQIIIPGYTEQPPAEIRYFDPASGWSTNADAADTFLIEDFTVLTDQTILLVVIENGSTNMIGPETGVLNPEGPEIPIIDGQPQAEIHLFVQEAPLAEPPRLSRRFANRIKFATRIRRQ